MSVRSSQSITVEFTTSRFDTGAATNADSLPTGTLIVNGADNGATVTVNNIDAGRYKAAVTLPTLSVGDIVELSIAATVNSVAGKGIVWRDTKDVVIDSAGLVDANTVKLGPTGAGTAQTARDIGLSVLVAAAGLDLVLVDGKTLPAALRIIAAGVIGKVSGAGTGTEVFVGLDAATTRATVTVDASGNRSAVVYG